MICILIAPDKVNTNSLSGKWSKTYVSWIYCVLKKDRPRRLQVTWKIYNDVLQDPLSEETYPACNVRGGIVVLTVRKLCRLYLYVCLQGKHITLKIKNTMLSNLRQHNTIPTRP